MTVFAQTLWERVVASGVVGLGVATIAAGGMALLQKRPPSAVEGEPDDAPPPWPRITRPAAWMLIVIGLALAIAGSWWRTSLGL
jgi:hypothetical protein